MMELANIVLCNLMLTPQIRTNTRYKLESESEDNNTIGINLEPPDLIHCLINPKIKFESIIR